MVDGFRCGILSGAATGASWLCYFKALQLGNVNKVTPVDKSSTILAIIFAFLFLGETPTLWMGFGIVLLAAGTYLMIELRAAEPSGVKSRSWLWYVILSAVFAALTCTIAFSYIFLKEKLSRKAFIGLLLVISGTMLLLF